MQTLRIFSKHSQVDPVKTIVLPRFLQPIKAIAVDNITNKLYAVIEKALYVADKEKPSWVFLYQAYAKVNAIALNNIDNIIYLATRDGIQVSHDGGMTWQHSITNAFNKIYSIFVGMNKEKAFLLAATDAGLNLSIDQGETWELITLDIDEAHDKLVVSADSKILSTQQEDRITVYQLMITQENPFFITLVKQFEAEINKAWTLKSIAIDENQAIYLATDVVMKKLKITDIFGNI